MRLIGSGSPTCKDGFAAVGEAEGEVSSRSTRGLGCALGYLELGKLGLLWIQDWRMNSVVVHIVNRVVRLREFARQPTSEEVVLAGSGLLAQSGRNPGNLNLLIAFRQHFFPFLQEFLDASLFVNPAELRPLSTYF